MSGNGTYFLTLSQAKMAESIIYDESMDTSIHDDESVELLYMTLTEINSFSEYTL